MNILKRENIYSNCKFPPIHPLAIHAYVVVGDFVKQLNKWFLKNDDVNHTYSTGKPGYDAVLNFYSFMYFVVIWGPFGVTLFPLYYPDPAGDCPRPFLSPFSVIVSLEWQWQQSITL